jgi:hypothetical protein
MKMFFIEVLHLQFDCWLDSRSLMLAIYRVHVYVVVIPGVCPFRRNNFEKIDDTIENKLPGLLFFIATFG